MTSASSRTRGVRQERGAAMVVAVAFLGAGILGFVPGMTTGLDGMTFAGRRATRRRAAVSPK